MIIRFYENCETGVVLHTICVHCIHKFPILICSELFVSTARLFRTVSHSAIQLNPPITCLLISSLIANGIDFKLV